MKQTVGNACGTVGILHSIINARDSLTIQPNSYLTTFLNNTLSLSSEERADYLEKDDDIEVVHEAAATAGQSDQVCLLSFRFLIFSLKT